VIAKSELLRLSRLYESLVLRRVISHGFSLGRTRSDSVVPQQQDARGVWGVD
jgi:hypothetical protein